MNALTTRSLIALLLLPLIAAPARAQLHPEWVGVVPSSALLNTGLADCVTDTAGVTYFTGTGGASSNTNVYTAAFAPDGSMLWEHVFNGPGNWHDQGHGISLAPGGIVYVAGNTPGPGSYANVLLLKYEAATGTLLKTVQYSSAPSTAEYGASVAVDALGNVYIGGGTVGDGLDAMMLSFDPAGKLRWKAVYDGPAFVPWSQDAVRQVQVDANGDVFAMINGIFGTQPDYVMIKYSGVNGEILWSTNWGTNSGETVADMVLDANGDVYLTGTAIGKIGTIKLDGNNGDLLWQAFDQAGLTTRPYGIAVDDQGSVYITGRNDIDGDLSNFNNQFITVKHDATTGELLWTHIYGATCVGCYDVAYDVIVNSSGQVLVVGETNSPPYGRDMILLVLDADTGIELDRGVVSGPSGWGADGYILRFDAAQNIHIGGEFTNATIGQNSMVIYKFGALGSWDDLGNGMAGTGGLTPRLTGSGPLSAGSDNQALLADALPGAATNLVFGLARIDAPFKGGVLVPNPDVLLLGLPVNADGVHTLEFTWPAGVPSGTPIYLQHWVADPASPAGFAASNGLQGLTQ